ncbi:response regulator [Candidatus Auribacterota bacterium]
MKKADNQKKCILIVDDDKDMRHLYSSFFSGDERYEIDTASGGKAGYGKLKEKKYDLVILDMIMEDMAGDSLFAAVQKDSKNTDTPVIVVSVLCISDNAVDFILRRKNTGYLKKPIIREQLFDKVELFL